MIENSAFFKCENLVELEISSVKTLCSFSFSQTPIKEVKLGAEVIGNGVFLDCTELESVELGLNLKKLGNKAFKSTSISSIELPESLEEMGSDCFSDCKELISVNWKCSRISVLSKNCFSGTVLKEFKAESLIEIGPDAFRETPTLTTLNIPNVQTLRSGCFALTGLHTLTFPKKLTIVENEVFGNCYHLFEVKFNNCVRRLESFCFRNASFKSVVLPGNVEEIGKGCFMHCDKLVKFEGKGVKVLGEYCLNGCGKLGVVKINEVERIGDKAFQNCKKLNNLILGSKDVNIGSSVFEGCVNLLSKFNSKSNTEQGIIKYNQNNPLMIMLYQQSPLLSNLKKLHEENKDWIKGTEWEGNRKTCLAVYAESGFKIGIWEWLFEVCGTLIEEAEVSVRDVNGDTILHVLFGRKVEVNDFKIFEEMLRVVNERIGEGEVWGVKNFKGGTCLHVLAERGGGGEEVWKGIIEKVGGEVLRIKNEEGLTVLHMLCQKSTLDVGLINLFCEKEGNKVFTEVDEFGYTVLHTIVQRHKDIKAEDIVKVIKKSDLSLKDGDGFTVGGLGRKKGCRQVVCDLLEGGGEGEDFEGLKEEEIGERIRLGKVKKGKTEKE
ncbi:hypothetical protein TrLO_g4778 [Triparma laevis f. longispina]|uniref:Uncharacterized protein n=1 Tax=Triparma laevis f. longispina TaxID=1714387 RepID=A0A9W6ZP75_9STRA|nr:hypothetical protein TrLO_g4778 [Triparma laevis f. longispina]